MSLEISHNFKFSNVNKVGAEVFIEYLNSD